MFKNNNINLDNNKLTIEVANLAEKMKLTTISDKMKEKLNNYGYNKLDVEIKINNELNNEILKEIEQELSKEVKIIEPVKVDEPKEEEKKRFIPKDYKRPPLIVEKDNPNVVIGRTIEDKPIRMDQIATEQNNVTIEGYIYQDPEIRETKTDLKIITLKLTDKTDSIYAKIFVNDEEEFNHIKKHLTVGPWFRFKGNLKDDKYSNELTYQIRDMNVIEHNEE